MVSKCATSNHICRFATLLWTCWSDWEMGLSPAALTATKLHCYSMYIQVLRSMSFIDRKSRYIEMRFQSPPPGSPPSPQNSQVAKHGNHCTGHGITSRNFLETNLSPIHPCKQADHAEPNKQTKPTLLIPDCFCEVMAQGWSWLIHVHHPVRFMPKISRNQSVNSIKIKLQRNQLTTYHVKEWIKSNPVDDFDQDAPLGLPSWKEGCAELGPLHFATHELRTSLSNTDAILSTVAAAQESSSETRLLYVVIYVSRARVGLKAKWFTASHVHQ